MPLLGPDDPLPVRPQRVLVAGTAGSGKTTLAGRITRGLALPQLELDSLFHGPDWTPRESFVRDVDRFTAQHRWITEWQYPAVREMLLERADLLVWLDFPRRLVMRQLVRRTLHRRIARAELWNGNREPPLRTILNDPEHIIRWAWSTHGEHPRRIAEVRRQRPDLAVVRLRSRAESDRWLAMIIPEGVRPDTPHGRT